MPSACTHAGCVDEDNIESIAYTTESLVAIDSLVNTPWQACHKAPFWDDNGCVEAHIPKL